MSFALFIKPSFWPTLVSYLYSFGIQLLTSNSYALHSTSNTAAIDNSHRIHRKMGAEIYSCSFATSPSTDTHKRSLSYTHTLSLFVTSKLTLNSKTTQSGDALLLFRRRGRMRMLRRLLRVLYGLLLDNPPLPISPCSSITLHPYPQTI